MSSHDEEEILPPSFFSILVCPRDEWKFCFFVFFLKDRKKHPLEKGSIGLAGAFDNLTESGVCY